MPPTTEMDGLAVPGHNGDGYRCPRDSLLQFSHAGHEERSGVSSRLFQRNTLLNLPDGTASHSRVAVCRMSFQSADYIARKISLDETSSLTGILSVVRSSPSGQVVVFNHLGISSGT